MEFKETGENSLTPTAAKSLKHSRQGTNEPELVYPPFKGSIPQACRGMYCMRGKMAWKRCCNLKAPAWSHRQLVLGFSNKLLPCRKACLLLPDFSTGVGILVLVEIFLSLKVSNILIGGGAYVFT